MRGWVTFYKEEKKFGFISTSKSNSKESYYFSGNYVHFEVRVGMEVEFIVENGNDGRPRANRVTLVTQQSQADGETGNQERQEEHKFRNPYNFVRTLPKKETKFWQNAGPITHESYKGKSGSMKCRLKVITPLFISDGNPQPDEEIPKHNVNRFFNIQGKPIIPGSSLRGMYRSVYEAITNSCFSVFDDKTLSRRMEGAEGGQLVPARVDIDNGEWKLELLQGYSQSGRHTNPQAAGWICRYKTCKYGVDGNKIFSPYRGEAGFTRSIVDLKSIKHKDQAFAIICKEALIYEKRFVDRDPMVITFWNIVGVYTDKSEAEKCLNSLNEKEKYSTEKGWVCITGYNFNRKHDEKFFFQPKEAESEKIPLTTPVKDEYEWLIADYKERHEKELKEKELEEKEPSKPGSVELSHFIPREDSVKLQKGDLVYCKLSTAGNGQKTVEYILPVQISRRPFQDNTGKLLPDHSPCLTIEKLCPACRLFGWMSGQKDEDSAQAAYAGRVSFTNAIMTNNKGEYGKKTLAELSAPKPTTTFFYLKNRNGKRVFINKKEGYQSDRQSLRGRKFYLHHANFQWIEEDKTPRNRSIIGAMKEGTEFEFDIKFTNLTDEELGALIWSVQMEDGLYNRLGYGKSLGLGSVKTSITDIVLIDPVQRYKSLKLSRNEKDNKKTSSEVSSISAKYLGKFYEECRKAYNADFAQLESVWDLRAIFSVGSRASLKVHYPRTQIPHNVNGNKSYQWFVNANNSRNNRNRFILPLASEDNGLPYN